MHCTEFLEHYSDYRDGLVEDQDVLRRMSMHLLSCPRCMRYDARVARGVTVLRTLSDIEPSPAFRRELADRLAGPAYDTDEPITPAPAGLMVALMLITAAALFLWHGSTAAPKTEVVEQASPPLPMVIVSPGVPFVGFAGFSVPAFDADWHTPGPDDDPYAIQTAISP